MRLVCSLVITLLLTIADCHGALIIDDFTTSQMEPASGLRGAVSGAGILGTERDIILDDTMGSVTIGGGNVIYTTPTNGDLNIEWDGIQGGDGSPDRARQLAVTDFTQSGLNDRFVVDVQSISGEWRIGVRATSGPSQSTSRTLFGITSTGDLEFFFADFISPSLLASANGIDLTLSPRFANQSITIGAFEAAPVPEPATWLLTGAAAAVAIFVRRRRRR